MIIISSIVVMILVIMGAIFSLSINEFSKDKVSVEQIILEKKNAILYVENGNDKKCDRCDKIKKYLNHKNIRYIMYDINNHTKEEYQNMLKSLTINPNDFGYPAIIYIKDGNAYADIIHIKNIDIVDQFIDKYHLENKSILD